MPFQFRSNGRNPGRNDAPLPNEQESLIESPFADLESRSDEDLFARLACGTHDALTVLFERHRQLVLGIARRALKDEGEAEEVLQQVFFDIYKAAKLFDREKGSFKIWLLQYAYHRTMNRKKHLAAKGFYTTEELADQILPAELYDVAGRSLRLASSELERLIEQLLDTIQPRQREAIELTFFHGFTAEEIAIKTGETPSAVRHNIYRGLHKLRVALLHSEQVQKKRTVKSVSEAAVFAYPESL